MQELGNGKITEGQSGFKDPPEAFESLVYSKKSWKCQKERRGVPGVAVTVCLQGLIQNKLLFTNIDALRGYLGCSRTGAPELSLEQPGGISRARNNQGASLWHQEMLQKWEYLLRN